MDELKLSPKTIRLIVNELVEPLVQQLVPIIIDHVDSKLKHDEVVDKGTLAKRLTGTANYDAINDYMYLTGFPTMPKANPDQRDRFSLRAVDKWIAENQQYHN